MADEEERMSELKPCPFCGSKGVLNQKECVGTWIVECSNQTCFASYMIGWDYDSPLEAVKAWNTRAGDVENCDTCKYYYFEWGE